MRFIDSISRYSGWVGGGLCCVLVLIIVYSVIMRYIFNAPTIWGYETVIMLGGTIYALSFAYTHWKHAHVRVDIFYSEVSLRKRAVVDVLGALFAFFPLLAVLVSSSFIQMRGAWLIGEVSTRGYWYPPLAPFRTIVFIGFCLLAFQAAAQFIRDSYFLIRGKAYD
ncbi:hypothetical protein ES708_13735 [subsurface metagenome]